MVLAKRRALFQCAFTVERKNAWRMNLIDLYRSIKRDAGSCVEKKVTTSPDPRFCSTSQWSKFLVLYRLCCWVVGRAATSSFFFIQWLGGSQGARSIHIHNIFLAQLGAKELLLRVSQPSNSFSIIFISRNWSIRDVFSNPSR